MIEGVQEPRGRDCDNKVPEEFARMSHTGERGSGVQILVENSQQQKDSGNKDAWL